MKPKTKWKPEEGEECWAIGWTGVVVILYEPWFHKSMLKQNRVFKTKRQALEVLRKIKKILREEWDGK